MGRGRHWTDSEFEKENYVAGLGGKLPKLFKLKNICTLKKIAITKSLISSGKGCGSYFLTFSGVDLFQGGLFCYLDSLSFFRGLTWISLFHVLHSIPSGLTAICYLDLFLSVCNQLFGGLYSFDGVLNVSLLDLSWANSSWPQKWNWAEFPCLVNSLASKHWAVGWASCPLSMLVPIGDLLLRYSKHWAVGWALPPFNVGSNRGSSSALQSTLSSWNGGGGEIIYCQWEVDRKWFYITLGMVGQAFWPGL